MQTPSKYTVALCSLIALAFSSDAALANSPFGVTVSASPDTGRYGFLA